MKILYLTTSTELGGAEKALAQLVLSSAQIHTVRVVCLRSEGEVAQRLKQRGIEVISLNLTKNWPGKAIRSIQTQLDDFKPDLVHAFLYWAMELGRIACAGRPIKFISSPHFDLSKRPLYQRWLDFLLKGLDTLTVAESFSTATYLIEHQKYRREKVYFLPNGVDKTLFFKDESLKKTLREKYHFTEENVIVIQVSRLEPVKNPMLLLQAFRNVVRVCPQARLIFVGGGSEQERLFKFAQESDISNYILFAGTQQNINEWLNIADIFVLPSKEESLPLALLEAFCVGLPAVVSKAGDMPLWVEHGDNGFVFPPGDITVLSCFLTELVQHSEIRRKFGLSSLEKSRKIALPVPQYQQLYEQIFKGGFHVKTKE